MRFIIGLIGICIGLLTIKYRLKVRETVGTIGFAEKYFGMGGTYTFIVLASSLLVVLSVMFMTGQLQAILINFLGPFF
jgi:hypothetical protein